MTPTINKPTRVTRNKVTTIDQIITNTAISGIEHKSVIKNDHFLIVFVLNTCEKNGLEDKAQFLKEHIYGEV